MPLCVKAWKRRWWWWWLGVIMATTAMITRPEDRVSPSSFLSGSYYVLTLALAYICAIHALRRERKTFLFNFLNAILQPLKNTWTSSSNCKAWDGPYWIHIGFNIDCRPSPWYHIQGFIRKTEIFLPETAQLSLFGTEGHSRCFLGDLTPTTASFPRTQSCRLSSEFPSVHHSCDNETIGSSCQLRAVTAGAPCHRSREDWRLPHKYSNLQWDTAKSPLITPLLSRFHISPCQNRRIQ